MAGLMEKLTASGGRESAGFLNTIIEQLWPNINVAGSRMVKEIVEPMFATMLPGPLAGLRFVKIDLGDVPLSIAAVEVHKTDLGGIKLDMDVVWDGKSDVELDAHMVPKIGIERVQLKGRLSILLAPLTNIIPLIGAAQVAFINPPSLKLDFTDAAEIADWVLIDKVIRKCIMNIISSMAVLPNRYLVKLDANNDYFQTYLPPVGALRLTVDRAIGLRGPQVTGAKRLLEKMHIKDTPDYFCRVTLGAEDEWRTSVKKDSDSDPSWNEAHDFLVADDEQDITVDVQDEDLVGDDDIGIASTSVRHLLLAGGEQELPLTMHDGTPTDAKVVVRAEFFDFVEDAALLSGSRDREQGEEGRIAGLATVIIGNVRGLQPDYQSGDDKDKKPLPYSVRVAWGERDFLTAGQNCTTTDDSGNVSYNNHPAFDQAFRFPLAAAALAAEGGPAAFRMVLLNGKRECGVVEVPFEDVLGAPGMRKEESFDLGAGVSVRARIELRALRPAQMDVE
ncbi:hypothetical protein PG993_004420 [Apiospora rasikravindrae]|uniref:C2 domain-containing protein n=1 Tax=Apiospora rasikravindrae TaxID=990691 RepID=A0ABR1TCQ0_9PEZI